MAVAILAAWAAPAAHGAVAASGNVTPVLPAGGGDIPGPITVGATGVGTVLINNSSVLNLTAGSATLASAAESVGIVNLTGLGSSFSTSSDLIIGNAGAGSLVASNLSRVSVVDDVVLAVADGSSGTLFVDALGSIMDVGDSIAVGQAGTALVQVSAGGRLFADDAVIGQNATGDGTVTVSGNGSLWQQSNTMTIGEAGRGLVQVLSQGRLETTTAIVGNAATGTGVVNVSGAGSQWDVSGALTVASSGQGTLNVIEGARVANTGVAKLGALAAGEGRVLVSGANSTWNAGTQLVVGDLGVASLRITLGGRVVSGNTVVADNTFSRGEALVDGVGSVWEVDGTLDVSDPGEALLTISSGGLVRASGLVRVAPQGHIALGGGRLQAAAAGGLTNQGLVEGAGRIQAAVTNAASGKIRTHVGGSLEISGALSNAGLVDLDGGELEVFGATTNSLDLDARAAVLRFGGGFTNAAGGQLSAIGGTVDVYGAVLNAVGGQIVVGGEAHAVFHDAVTNNGQLFVMPGASALMLENLSFGAGSQTTFQLGSAGAAATFGQIETAGGATLSGQLHVQLQSGFAPQAGDSFQLLTAAKGVTGMFAGETLPALASGLAWDVDYSATNLTLSVVPGLAADFNGNGVVDGADLASWKSGFGTPSGAAKTSGDADGDGDVDGADFLAWQREAGTPAAAGAAAPVPEPCATWLTACACGAILQRCRRPIGRRRQDS
jgi:T5SS/PEP-CTERM-associated repeat protein